MAMRSAFVLKKNDRIVFLGDSITEQQLYTNYVESYLVTYFPELQLTFFNAGWGGDTAPGGVLRLKRDVLSLKPSVVTICYGMNDASYALPSPEIFKTFKDGMQQLVDKLKRAGVRIVLLTPGFADTSVNANLKSVNYNKLGLRRLADAVLDLAAREKLPVADIHKLMTDVDARAKKDIDGFTMAPDGFHPSPPGHLVMAYGLLQAMGIPPRKRQLKLHLASKALHTLEIPLDRLPFYVEPEARKVLPFLPFQETYNCLNLQLTGLKDKSYYFRMATERSLAFSKKQLEKGINLFSIFGMPAMMQAQKIHQFTFEKCQIYFKLWRMLSLGGANAAYDPGPHELARQSMPKLDKARERLATPPLQAMSLRMVSSQGKGEPLANGDFIGTWSLQGTFPLPFAKDYLGGEAAFSASVPGKGGLWQAQQLNIKNPENNLAQIFGPVTQCLAYAACVLDSPVNQEAQMLLGSDDGFAAWLNGELLDHQLDLKRGLNVDQNKMPIRLKKGKNVLLLKISQDTGNWGFCARFSGLSHDIKAEYAALG